MNDLRFPKIHSPNIHTIHMVSDQLGFVEVELKSPVEDKKRENFIVSLKKLNISYQIIK